MLIDDDPDMQYAIRFILEPRGYQVACQPTGVGGLEAIRRQPPDVILLDVVLASPCEGLELAAKLGEDAQLAQIPIIMISAIGQTMGLDFARELGSDYMPANQFLEKPIEAATLREAVQKALEAKE